MGEHPSLRFFTYFWRPVEQLLSVCAGLMRLSVCWHVGRRCLVCCVALGLVRAWQRTHHPLLTRTNCLTIVCVRVRVRVRVRVCIFFVGCSEESTQVWSSCAVRHSGPLNPGSVYVSTTAATELSPACVL